jgi:hypothetical protein
MESVIEGKFWRPTKKEILEWLEGKEWEFSWKENTNPWMKINNGCKGMFPQSCMKLFSLENL